MEPLPGDPAFAIDVVIPCYNASAYLAEAIESVISQNLDGIRILFIDDGSTDQSVPVARSFGSIVHIHSKVNGGIASARNSGIDLSTAPWLAFLDADDVWTPNSLEARFLAFIRNPNADLVYGQMEQFHSPEMNHVDRSRLPIDLSQSAARFAGTLLARAKAFKRVGSFNCSFAIGEMIDWVARSESAGLVTEQLEKVVLRRRIHGNNTTLRHASDRRSYIRALKSALDQKRKL